jgi:cold shock CspA family protein
MKANDLHYGVIKWYDSIKGYGFLADDLGLDYFFHATSLTGGFIPSGGKRISFTLGVHNDKPIAQNVQSE